MAKRRTPFEHIRNNSSSIRDTAGTYSPNADPVEAADSVALSPLPDPKNDPDPKLEKFYKMQEE